VRGLVTVGLASLNFPREIRREIFFNLSACDLLIVSQVCTLFNKTLDNLFWENFTKLHYPYSSASKNISPKNHYKWNYCLRQNLSKEDYRASALELPCLPGNIFPCQTNLCLVPEENLLFATGKLCVEGAHHLEQADFFISWRRSKTGKWQLVQKDTSFVKAKGMQWEKETRRLVIFIENSYEYWEEKEGRFIRTDIVADLIEKNECVSNQVFIRGSVKTQVFENGVEIFSFSNKDLVSALSENGQCLAFAEGVLFVLVTESGAFPTAIRIFTKQASGILEQVQKIELLMTKAWVEGGLLFIFCEHLGQAIKVFCKDNETGKFKEQQSLPFSGHACTLTCQEGLLFVSGVDKLGGDKSKLKAWERKKNGLFEQIKEVRPEHVVHKVGIFQEELLAVPLLKMPNIARPAWEQIVFYHFQKKPSAPPPSLRQRMTPLSRHCSIQ